MATNFNWQLVWLHYQSSYYAIVLMLVVSLVVVVKGITVKKKNRITHIITLYAAASFVQAICSSISWGYSGSSMTIWLPVWLTYFIFIFIEATSCYALVRCANIKAPIAKLLAITLLGFLIFVVVYLWYVPYKKWDYNIATITELPLLIFFCGTYYYHLVTQPPQTKLRQQPLFWAISGMALLAFCLIPFSLTYSYINISTRLAYLVDIIPFFVYSLVFIIHLKALQCSQKQLEP